MIKYLIILAVIFAGCSKNNTPSALSPENKIERKDEAIWNVSTIEANDLDFGIVGAKESKILSVQIKNDGTEDILGTPIVSNGNFSILTSNCVNLLKNKSCVMKLNFNAQGKELNNYTANLNFGSYVNIISAEIDRPILSEDSYFAINSSITNFNYGTIAYNQNILKTFRIVNNGQAILNKTLTISNSDFQIVYDQCSGKNLEPKKHCVFKVLLSGQNKNGALSTQLEYNSKQMELNALVKSRSEVSQELGVLTTIHNGQEYSSDIDYGTINLNGVALKSIYLKNTGTGSLVINNIAIDSPISIVNNYCNNVFLNPNQTCLIRTRIDANVKNNYEVNIASDLGHIVKNQKILYAVKEPGDKLSCLAQIDNAAIANLTWNGSSYSSCVVEACNPSYHIQGNACELDVIACSASNGTGTQTWNGTAYDICSLDSCNLSTEHIVNNECVPNVMNINIVQPTVGQGLISIQSSVLYGQDANLTYSPQHPYKLNSWGGDCSGTSNSCSITNVTSSKNISVNIGCVEGFYLNGAICSSKIGTGGTITYTDSNGLNPRENTPYIGGYVVHTFTNTGSATFSFSEPTKTINYLVVGAGGGASGGSAGVYYGAGGGGGHVLQGTLSNLAAQSYSVFVGSGGTGTTGTSANNGGGSNFHNITASGGSAPTGRSGGSSAFPGSSTYPGQYDSGGGGGAGGAGSNGSGGIGINSSISGLLVGYGGGGIGSSSGASASHGGGSSPFANGATNRGGGGAGGHSAAKGGNGGSGIVIIRYQY